MRLKAILISVLAAAALLCCPAAAYGGGLPVLSDWAIGYYSTANTQSLMNWFCRDGDFTAPITRAELADMLLRSVLRAHPDAVRGIDPLASAPFEDTQRYSVFCLAQMGLLEPGGSFGPEEHVTREEAAQLYSRCARYLGLEADAPTAEFADADGVSPEFADAVRFVSAAGLMVGTDTGAFSPRGSLTREQAVAVAVRLAEACGEPDKASAPTVLGITLERDDNAFYCRRSGKALLTLPLDIYSCAELHLFDGKCVVSVSSGGKTSFIVPESGETLFTLDGYLSCVTNRYIITKDYRYGGENVDSVYTVYGVYALDGSAVVPLGASEDGIYLAGYIEDL